MSQCFCGLIVSNTAFWVQGYANSSEKKKHISGQFMTKKGRNDAAQQSLMKLGLCLCEAAVKVQSEGRKEKNTEARHRVQVQTQQLTHCVTLDKLLSLWGCGHLSYKML